MFNIKKLKISGFKSFPYPLEIDIPEGITGIIGPNGCGKSNIFEAIRWVMGESSSKSLRSSSMEELIFSGTDNVPEKNIAEVTVDLEINEENKKQFGDDKLIVSRHLERGVGSFYKINNKDVRAKDISILFSDSGSGPRSSSIISQGNIDQIINFKPLERKIILEDAAGISGLQTRRHDSELKLNATEKNLERIGDNISILEKQKQSLKRQSRQAENYQKISDQIKYNQKKLFYIQWKNSSIQKSSFLKNTKIFENKIKIIEQELDKLSAASNDIKVNFEKCELEKLTLDKKMNKIILEKETVVNQKQNLALRRTEVQNFLLSLENDQTREHKRIQEIRKNITELNKLIVDSNNSDNLKKSLDSELANEANLNEKISKLESILYSEIQLTLGEEFKKDNFIESNVILNKKKKEIEKELEKLSVQIKIKKNKTNIKILKDLENNINGISFKIKLLKNDRLENEKKLRIIERDIEKRSKDLDVIFNNLTRNKAELNTLKKFAQDIDNSKRSMINLIKIKNGYEKAVYTVLNYDLDAELSESKKYWVEKYNHELPDLPKSIDRLSNYVSGPKQLDQILSQIGVVKKKIDGSRASRDLKVGQYIVSTEGYVWRWDGLFSEKETEISKWFSQGQKIRELEKNILILNSKMSECKKSLDKIKIQKNGLINNDLELYKNQQNFQKNLDKENIKLAQQKNKVLVEQAFIDKLIERQNLLLDHKKKVTGEISDIEDKLKLGTSKPSEKNQTQLTLDNLKDQIKKKRIYINQINQKILSMEIKANHYEKNLEENLNREKESINQLNNYEKRITKLRHERQNLDVQPDNFDQKINSIVAETQMLQNKIDKNNNHIELNNSRLNQNNEKIRTLNNEKNQINNQKIRLEENTRFHKDKLTEIEENIRKTFGIHPTQMEKDFDSDNKDSSESKDFREVEKVIEDLINKRNLIGPVNLRAYIEQKEVSKELEGMISERDDIMLAIKKLRKAITEINQEGKRRLLKAFDKVNENFSKLFKKFFIGGDAHLELVNSDDPLQTGIEIYAKPPGKKLSSISLLSGGEKTLTAISLIFSIFLIKPSPICILDEVDAALDDENVGKFCEILNEIKNQTRTKFLIVTHHKITMSMVDKIYGVTMNQKGISDVVSVSFDDNRDYQEAI